MPNNLKRSAIDCDQPDQFLALLSRSSPAFVMAVPSAAWMQAIVVGATMGTCQLSWQLGAREVSGKLNILSSSAIISGWVVDASLGIYMVVGDEIGVISIERQ